MGKVIIRQVVVASTEAADTETMPFELQHMLGEESLVGGASDNDNQRGSRRIGSRLRSIR